MIKPNVDLKYIMEVEDILLAANQKISEAIEMRVLDPHAQHALSNIQGMLYTINSTIMTERYVLMNAFESAKDDQKELLVRAEHQRQKRLKIMQEQDKKDQEEADKKVTYID